jgi:hypothetical protein
MKWYWAKIALGALAVFLVGYAGVRGVRAVVEKGRSVMETSEPIRIPLAFIPFSLDGREVGTFQQVVIRREAPKVVEGLDARIRLADTAIASTLAGCRVTPAARRDFDLGRGFLCLEAGASDSALVEIGSLRFLGPGVAVEVPFLVDSAVAADLRGQNGLSEATARITGDEATAEGRAKIEIRRRSDSAGRSVKVEVRPGRDPQL